MIEFLEENGYNVSYIDQGTVASPQGTSLIEQHKVFMATGHDEYWSGPEVANVKAARNKGVNLTFFSGNEVYWKIRWAADAAGKGLPLLAVGLNYTAIVVARAIGGNNDEKSNP